MENIETNEVDVNKEIERIEKRIAEIDKMENPDEDYISERRLLDSKLENLKESREKGF